MMARYNLSDAEAIIDGFIRNTRHLDAEAIADFRRVMLETCERHPTTEGLRDFAKRSLLVAEDNYIIGLCGCFLSLANELERSCNAK